jgi:FKBP-type peptidyl-prolyl cis-trans isomerase
MINKIKTILRYNRNSNLMNYFKTFAAATVVMTLAGCNTAEKPTQELKLETQQQRISYLAASDFANSFKQSGVSLDADAIALAVRDVMAGKVLRLSQEEIQQTMETWQAEMLARKSEMDEQQEGQQAEQNTELNQKAEENAAIGVVYLMANAEKEGVVTLESGLQYKVLVEGTGPKPTAENTVEVNYRGTLVDGTEFDSSYARNKPATFGVTQVIPGWIEALQLMPEGSKWELAIPADLAYGPGGAGELIGPNATLVFEIELLDANVE